MYESDDFKYLAREFPGRVYAQLKNNVNHKEKIPFFRPRDAIEFKLIEIAKTVLGVDNVGVSDNLMDFGFESVRVVEFIEALNNEFSKAFPLSVIIENPSLEKIALLIRNESANSLESQIVLLRKGNSNKCVFCIHTIGGNPYIYYELSAQLSPEYAVFGIQAKGLEEGEEPLQTIEEMGKLYANQILEISPDGPVLIIGYSSAAIIAYELANQLQRERRRKALLLFIDPLSPNAIRETRSVDDVELQFRATLGEALIKSEDEWIEYWESHRQEIAAIKTDQERLVFLENQLSLAPAVFFPDFGEKRLRRFLSTYMSIYKALWNYSPQYIFRGKIHMLRTHTKDGEINKHEEDFGWKKNATDGVVIEVIYGEHLSVLNEPMVSVVSNIINKWIT